MSVLTLTRAHLKLEGYFLRYLLGVSLGLELFGLFYLGPMGRIAGVAWALVYVVVVGPYLYITFSLCWDSLSVLRGKAPAYVRKMESASRAAAIQQHHVAHPVLDRLMSTWVDIGFWMTPTTPICMVAWGYVRGHLEVENPESCDDSRELSIDVRIRAYAEMRRREQRIHRAVSPRAPVLAGTAAMF